MPTLNKIFDKCGVALYQNESLDLDHYYQEPYQDEGDEIKVIGEPFESDKSSSLFKHEKFGNIFLKKGFRLLATRYFAGREESRFISCILVV